VKLVSDLLHGELGIVVHAGFCLFLKQSEAKSDCVQVVSQAMAIESIGRLRNGGGQIHFAAGFGPEDRDITGSVDAELDDSPFDLKYLKPDVQVWEENLLILAT
jgi:hypothetical protein